ncbi:MAG: 4-hydroxy-3-methylbut-2-enyl diphosphate reductase [Candidatus Dormiibacterota bacterium]|jgi:4-hydroxy-3-methylbut-2-enyl diphosphate reductase
MGQGEETVALGQVVHNARALEGLERQGLGRVEALPDAGGPQVVVTAHGATPQLFAEANQRGLKLVDTTCPLVRRVQVHAVQLADEGWPVVVVGSASHAEVKALVGWAAERQDSEVELIASEAEADQLPRRARRGVVCQSTFPKPRFDQIVARLRLRTDDLQVRDTTCPVVNQRQREAITGLLDQADVVLVVGGRESANTKALADTCAERLPTFQVESASEIRASWFQAGQRVGITSGTSTPSWVVDEVEAVCRDL